MTEREFEEYEAVVTPHAKYWLPIQWLLSLVTLARDESRIKGEHIYVSLCEQIAAYRVKLVRLVLFDWVPVPLVYTQVVHLAVYSYFLVALFGRQYLDRDAVKKSINIYVPIMTILQFTFIVGWLKVAEVLLNPLGEDDDDFECNWIIDRNLQVGFSVEECYNQYPPVDRDSFWTDSNPEPLYTAMSAMRPTNPQVGSCVNMSATSDSEFMLRPKRSLVTSRTSIWDGHIDSNDIVPVMRCSSREEDMSPSLLHSESSSSIKGFLKQLRRHGRRMSSILRRRAPPYEVRAPDCISESSNSSLERDGAIMIATNSRDPPTSLDINEGLSSDNKPSTEQGMTLNVPNLSKKRHSAPDALQIISRRKDSPNTKMLPVIIEEKDRVANQSSDSSVHKKRRSSTGSLPKV